ncbi:hypothetical protein D3C78_1534640 [compost metagenome]
MLRPLTRYTSSARTRRCGSLGWMRAADSGSTRASSACSAARPSAAAWASSRARTAGSAEGISARPSSSALKYSMVPPTSSGMRPAAVISAIAASASLRNSAAE